MNNCITLLIFIFFKIEFDRRSLFTGWCFHCPLMITMCSGHMLCIFTVFVLLLVHMELVFQQGDRTLLFWVTHSSEVVTVYCIREKCDSNPVHVQQWPPRIYKQWLTPSLKQSHYKLDMTSVTPAIIRGQDSWPLPVVVHVVIRHNATHWLAAEPRSKSCFIMLPTIHCLSYSPSCHCVS